MYTPVQSLQQNGQVGLLLVLLVVLWGASDLIWPSVHPQWSLTLMPGFCKGFLKPCDIPVAADLLGMAMFLFCGTWVSCVPQSWSWTSHIGGSPLVTCHLLAWAPISHYLEPSWMWWLGSAELMAGIPWRPETSPLSGSQLWGSQAPFIDLDACTAPPLTAQSWSGGGKSNIQVWTP
jgi:hypothetical protein